MLASISSGCSSIAGPNASRPNFPSWLTDQIARSDEIGHLSRLAFLNGVIDRSDRELVHEAIVEWASGQVLRCSHQAHLTAVGERSLTRPA